MNTSTESVMSSNILSSSDEHLIKLKSAGISDAIIAKKLSIPESEVSQRYHQIWKHLSGLQGNGYIHLSERFTNLCQQYQSMGESLKTIAYALSDHISDEDLSRMVTGDRQETMDNLRQNCIILKAFVPPSPEEEIESTSQGN